MKNKMNFIKFLCILTFYLLCSCRPIVTQFMGMGYYPYSYVNGGGGLTRFPTNTYYPQYAMYGAYPCFISIYCGFGYGAYPYYQKNFNTFSGGSSNAISFFGINNGGAFG